MEKYQNFALLVQEKLRADIGNWLEKYNGYADYIEKNGENIRQARKLFHRWKPLEVYVTIGKIIDNSLEFDLRYLGQSVATIKCDTKSEKSKSVTLTIDETKAENNKKYFDYEGEFSNVSWSESWEAEAFRKYFKEISPDKLPRQKEHKLESLLFSEFEKTSSNEKSICGIQPIAFGGSRIHMKTALAASKAIEGKVGVPEKNGGDIDIFCTRNKKLTVIEVKDENTTKESLEKAINQAIAYSVFIRELLRSSDEYGRKWFKIWGMDESNLKESITINAVVAMPYVKEETPKFTGKSINIGNDKIALHYMLIKEDEGKLTFDTSL